MSEEIDFGPYEIFRKSESFISSDFSALKRKNNNIT